MLIQGHPMIYHVLHRVQQAKRVDEVISAIPKELNNEPLMMAASELGIFTFEYCGDPSDLIGRYAQAAALSKADVVVRVPGDNPVVDSDEIDRIIDTWQQTPFEHRMASNLDRDVMGSGYPGGLGAEVYDPRFLGWMRREVKDERQREHVHAWPMENNRVFSCKCPEAIRRPDLDFSVNTQADFDFITDIYNALYPIKPDFRIKDILSYLDRKKEVHFE